MLVLMQNIPQGVKIFELSKFIEQVANKGVPESAKIRIRPCEVDILDMVDGDRIVLQQVALVKVFPNNIANNLIKKLDGQVIRSHALKVKPFFHRSELNDRRKNAFYTPQELMDRRVEERRKSTLVGDRQ